MTIFYPKLSQKASHSKLFQTYEPAKGPKTAFLDPQRSKDRKIVHDLIVPIGRSVTALRNQEQKEAKINKLAIMGDKWIKTGPSRLKESLS